MILVCLKCGRPEDNWCVVCPDCELCDGDNCGLSKGCAVCQWRRYQEADYRRMLAEEEEER